MNKIRLFLNPIEGREKFINEMARKGYRLVKSGSILHNFEKTNSDYRYAVQYIGYMSNNERKRYTEFLNDMNLKVFTAPLNIGKFSFGNIKLRPYNFPKNMIATSPGVINKEILIIESDGNKEIPVFTDINDRKLDTKRRKMPYYYIIAVSIFLIVLGLFKNQEYKLIFLGGILFLLSIFSLYLISSSNK